MARADTKEIHWTGGVYALQSQLKLSIHPGESTALALRGYSHNVSFHEKVYIFGTPTEKLPTWFLEYDWKAELIYRTTNLFPDRVDYGLEKYDLKTFSINISTPERAIMEVLSLVPQSHSFEQAVYAMENLLTLRPAVVQALLENCNSVKVNRTFLYLAESLHMPWFTALDLNKIDLGKGKRVIAEGGTFNKKYQISVPHLEALSQ